MDREELHRRLTGAAETAGHVSERVHDLLAAVVDEMAVADAQDAMLLPYVLERVGQHTGFCPGCEQHIPVMFADELYPHGTPAVQPCLGDKWSRCEGRQMGFRCQRAPHEDGKHRRRPTRASGLASWDDSETQPKRPHPHGGPTLNAIQVGSMSIQVDSLDYTLFADRVRRTGPDKIGQMSIVDNYGGAHTVTLSASERDALVGQLLALS